MRCASLLETVTEKSADAVLGAGPPLSLRVVRAGAPSLSLRSLQGQGGDFGFGSILSEGDQIPRPVAENATRTGHPFFCVVKAWASPPVKGPTLAAKNATRMGHPSGFPRRWNERSRGAPDAVRGPCATVVGRKGNR